MKIERTIIKVRDICEGFVNDPIEGVTALNGKLNVRPQYQREFVYDEEQRSLVIDSILPSSSYMFYALICQIQRHARVNTRTQSVLATPCGSAAR